MGWKDWPGWLRGGIIGAIIGLMFGALGRIINSLYIIPIFIEFLIGGICLGFVLSAKWFKSWPYWLKGGIVFVLITLFFMTVDESLNYRDLSHEGSPFYDLSIALWVLIGIPLGIFSPLIDHLLFFLGKILVIPHWLNIIIISACYFPIGAIIGWIIGKIKSPPAPAKY